MSEAEIKSNSNNSTPTPSSSYDDSTDSSEREFIEQQASIARQKQLLHLPRKSSTISIPRSSASILLDDENIDHDEFDSDDEDFNCSDLTIYEAVDVAEVAVSHTSGRRNYNEDRACCIHNCHGADIFAVFDGHNGHLAATLCRNVLKKVYDEANGDFEKTFGLLHNQVINATNAGCTATVVALKENEIEFANCGDSCAYIITKDKEIKKMTKDHKASDKEEEEMIVKNGGCVMNIFGAKRVNGQIMVTRSIGDKSLHPPMTHVPFINTIERDNVYSFCVMSDGVTDVLSEKEIQEIMISEKTVVEKAQALRNMAYKGGSKDNICAIVVELVN